MAKSKPGPKAKETKNVADKLNLLLANYQVFYINVRGFHWNITGEKFFELHVKFEELYNDLLLKIDEIAERTLTIGHTPLHSYTDYLAVATIKEAKNISDGKKAAQNILASFKSLIVLQRETAEEADDVEDEGTEDLMTGYIREQEKIAWMYTAFLKN
jgi:starvation-inducible DNA-binding protein